MSVCKYGVVDYYFFVGVLLVYGYYLDFFFLVERGVGVVVVYVEIFGVYFYEEVVVV